MVPDFERAGLQFVGKDESGRRMEVDLELFSWILQIYK
jgi:CTP synthase